MKKLFALLGLLVFLVPSMALAAEFQSTDVVAKDTTPKNLYVANQTVTVDANVSGDLTAAGSTVIVNGNVENSANLAGSTIFLKGNVGQNAHVAGGNVNIDGTIGEDLVVFAGQVNLGSSSIVKGDVLVYGGTVTLNGRVDGKVVGSGGNVVINGLVAGNVDLKNVGTLSLTDKAVIGGNLKYSANESAKVSDKAVVKGQTDFKKVTVKNRPHITAGVSVFGLLFGAVGAFLLLWIVTLLLPKASKSVVENAFKNPWANIGIGFAVLVAAPVAMVIALVTLIGAPIAGIGFLLYILAMVFSGLYASLIIGSWVYKMVAKSDKFEVNWKVVLVGVLLMGLLKLIPIIGWIFVFGFFLMALGSISGLAVSLVKAQK